MRPLAILLAICSTTAAAQSAVETELRQSTQALLDAIAPGDTATWNRLLDPRMIQVDENDIVHTKAQVLQGLQPLGPGLDGHIAIDDFRVALAGDAAVVTHEDDEYLNYHGQVIKSRFRMTDTWVHSPDGWRLMGEQVLAVLKDPPAVHMERATLCRYAGRYALVPDIVQTVRCADDRLIVSRDGRPDRTFLPESPDVFFEPGSPRTRRMFQRDTHGQVTGFVDRREARDVIWKRIS